MWVGIQVIFHPLDMLSAVACEMPLLRFVLYVVNALVISLRISCFLHSATFFHMVDFQLRRPGRRPGVGGNGGTYHYRGEFHPQGSIYHGGGK